MHVCSRCTRSFARKRCLDYHIHRRQTPCSKPTHHCQSCSKGLSSAMSFWRHKQSCKEKSDKGIVSFNSPDKVINSNPNEQMDIVSHVHPSTKTTADSGAINNGLKVQQGNEDVDDIEYLNTRAVDCNSDLADLLNRLKIIADLLDEGHMDMKSAYRDVVEQLHKLDVLSNEQYKSLKNVIA